MKLYNSLTRTVQNFKPLEDKIVKMYVCGITPYDTTHLGHAFTYIFFDTLLRYLKFQGYHITYTQNVTDINDRDKDLLKKAKEENIPWDKLAKYWTQRFLGDMQVLNWTVPTNYSWASKNIKKTIKLIQKLLDRGFAYQIKNSVYLDISKFPSFGKLSKLDKNQMIKTAKEFEEDLHNPDKIHPLDVTLWRGSTAKQPKHIPSFNSPFGKGRPGWHIECSAMSMSTLGEQIDIHGGGKDLIFPHHEAEIAQSEGASGKTPFVKYWLHTGTVYYKGKKMNKSKGNLVMVADLLKKYSPNAIRWLLLSNHWRENWEYKEEDLKKAQREGDLIELVIARSGVTKQSDPSIKQFTKIMDNNLDTPKALDFLLKSPSKKMSEVLGFKLEK